MIFHVEILDYRGKEIEQTETEREYFARLACEGIRRAVQDSVVPLISGAARVTVSCP